MNMPSLQSTLQTRQPAAQAAQGAQAAQLPAARSPSLDTWAAIAGSPQAVQAQALSGFHSGSWVCSASAASARMLRFVHVCNKWQSLNTLQLLLLLASLSALTRHSCSASTMRLSGFKLCN